MLQVAKFRVGKVEVNPLVVGGAMLLALWFDSGFVVDADGSPTAYHPLDGSGEHGDDAIGNAHCDPNDPTSDWCGAVLGHDGKPVVQGPGDPAPGFLVSPTSLFDPSKRLEDPLRYVNAREVPYAAVPDAFRKVAGVRFGDLGVAIYGNVISGFVVADASPHLGEGSMELARSLGIDSNPRRGGVDRGVRWIIFPGSAAPSWPRDVVELRAAALQRWAQVRAMIPKK